MPSSSTASRNLRVDEADPSATIFAFRRCTADKCHSKAPRPLCFLPDPCPVLPARSRPRPRARPPAWRIVLARDEHPTRLMSRPDLSAARPRSSADRELLPDAGPNRRRLTGPTFTTERGRVLLRLLLAVRVEEVRPAPCTGRDPRPPPRRVRVDRYRPGQRQIASGDHVVPDSGRRRRPARRHLVAHPRMHALYRPASPAHHPACVLARDAARVPRQPMDHRHLVSPTSATGAQSATATLSRDPARREQRIGLAGEPFPRRGNAVASDLLYPGRGRCPAPRG